MDVIINWFILIIIFVFDPLAVALVIAFSNALKVDKGVVDIKKVVEKRTLYDEEPDNEDDEDIPMSWDDEGQRNSLDVEVPEELDEDDDLTFQYENDDSDEDNVPNLQDIDGDGIVSTEERRMHYNSTAWRDSYNGAPYYSHPWFDWNKRERWINDREATNYWLNNKGGNITALEGYKSKYPTNFDKKTY